MNKVFCPHQMLKEYALEIDILGLEQQQTRFIVEGLISATETEW